MTLTIKIVSSDKGAYPVTDYRNGQPFSETRFLITQLMNRTITAVEHGVNYFKTNVSIANAPPKTILICKKDCIILPAKQNIYTA